MFCVQCGKEATDLTERGLCEPCFAERSVFLTLPERVDVEVCVHCGSRKRGEIWIPVTQLTETTRAVEEAAIEAAQLDKRVERARFHVDIVPQDERNFATTVSVAGTAEGFDVQGKGTALVRVRGGTCLRCSRRQGGYYEAIVQLRARDRDLLPEELAHARRIASRIIDRVVQEGDANAFVLKDLEVDGGLDVFFGTTNAGRMVAKSFAQDLGGRITEHPKLVGQKDGVDLYRMTFSVRIPRYRVGDVLVLDEVAWIVQSIGAKQVTMRRIDSGQARTFEREKVRRADILPRADAREAVVVSRAAGELQVLDPWTFATVTVLLPAGVEDVGDTVPVLRAEDGLLVLPPR